MDSVFSHFKMPSPPMGSAEHKARFDRRMEEFRRQPGWTGTPTPDQVGYAMGTMERPPSPMSPFPKPDNALGLSTPQSTPGRQAEAQMSPPSTPAQTKAPASRSKQHRAHTKAEVALKPRSSRSRLQPPVSPLAEARRSARIQKAYGPRTFRLPVPLDVDQTWHRSVVVGNEAGISLGCEGLMTDGRLCRAIAQTVGQANLPLFHYFHDGTICTQRAYFPTETAPDTFDHKPLDSGYGMTLGHLLTLLAQEQYRHWQSIAHNDEVVLQTLVGRKECVSKGATVRPHQVYIVGVRRRPTSRPYVYCYIPELEVRV